MLHIIKSGRRKTSLSLPKHILSILSVATTTTTQIHFGSWCCSRLFCGVYYNFKIRVYRTLFLIRLQKHKDFIEVEEVYGICRYMMVIHDRKLEILLLERAVAFSFPFDLYKNWILYANCLTQKMTIYSYLFSLSCFLKSVRKAWIYGGSNL